MAYFSALGGTGGTSATITVTYSEDFYGLTITATNGTTTLTKTATSSGTLVFDVSEGGTWVVSGTVEGATYSEQVDVFFEYTVPPLVALPDGSTALPVNDIQMWLKCAAIRDKTTYTTLSDVLGDTETLIALCADSNACDYMARSTNWASGVAADSTAMLIVGKYNYCANALLSNATWAEAICNSTYIDSVLDIKVPTMTSATAPSGEVSRSSASGNYPAYYAFDGNINTNWASSIATESWIQYSYPSPMLCKYVSIYDSGHVNQNIVIKGSNDGTNWTELATDTLVKQVWLKKYLTNNNTEYKHYRVYMSPTVSSENSGANIIQFYGRTDNANYIPLVPVMTSDTTPSGVCSASDVYSSDTPAYKAFDGNNSDGWLANSTTNARLIYEFPTAKNVKKASLSTYQFDSITHARVKNFKIEASNTGNSNDWTTLYTGVYDGAYTGETKWYSFDNNNSYLYYSVLVVDTYNSSTKAGLKNVQFCKKATNPIIHSAVEDSIFYMDDGSPVALCGIPVGDTIDVDLEAYKGQTLTLVSTVAKDPTNLSNDFTMPVRITPNITEIYLMPYGALYWYGYNNGVEAGTSANGWTGSHMGGSVTFNKDSASIIAGSGQETGLTTHDAITAFDKLHCIVNTSYNSTVFLMYGSKNYAGSALVQKTLSTGLTHDELTITSKTGYPMIYEYNNKTITGYAMWIE